MSISHMAFIMAMVQMFNGGNGIYSASGVLWSYSWRSVGFFFFFVIDVVLVSRMVVVEIDYVYGSKCKSKCLFSHRHLDNISDLLFSRVFCDGWVIIASFSWRHDIFYVLLYADTSFTISHVIVGEMLMSLRYQMRVDKEV